MYLCLIPKSGKTKEGKRHVTTAPGKLILAKNSKHQSCLCTKFARATINVLEELARFLGPSDVTFHSQDKKGKVPIGLTAASKQAPLLIYMEYKVTLPDQDYIITPQHKLIPSVIGDEKEKDFSGDAVPSSGPTYCAIRSVKHSGFSAYHHLQDMKNIRSPDIFDDSFNNDTSESKPVMIVTVDGGPDENPRYTKTIECVINYFTTQDLDAFFLATNAPERSAFNRIECQMVKFSQELSRILLLHDKFGSHLNLKGETIDPELGKKAFMHAGQILAEIWSGMAIDGHPFLVKYIYEEAEEGNTKVVRRMEKQSHS